MRGRLARTLITGGQAPSSKRTLRSIWQDINVSSEQAFSNPDGVHAPLGLYSHTVSVPNGTGLLYISGQVGVRPDGSAGESIAEQADQVFANIVALLRAHGLGPSSIVKLTTFIVAGQDGEEVRNARRKHLGSHRPASTAVYVSQLVDPRWFVEVEAIAALS
jgi:enamine deaminase RidA (YjgF/YER057c/UK114 family)